MLDEFLNTTALHAGSSACSGLSIEQQTAADRIKSFLDGNGQMFSLQGLAGTGKSTLLASIAKTLQRPIICAPTGRGAAVLRQKSDLPARTIHSLFHRLKSESRRADGRTDLEFSPRRRDGSLAGRVVLIDESSMVTAALRDDLLRTDCRIIAVGDPHQLPPVSGEPGFPAADFTLTKIHRQATGSPIIRQAHRVRFGHDYQPDGDAFQVVKKGSLDLLRAADVVLTYTHASRRFLNQLIRRIKANGEIPGVPADDGSFDPRSEYPRAGERVVVTTRNLPRHDLWTGDIEMLDEDVRPGDRHVTFFQVSESGSRAGPVRFPLQAFAGLPGAGGEPGGVCLDFGYARTVHASQGSEWPFVVVLDEFPTSDPGRRAWIYTALTRASQRVVVVNRHHR